MPSVVQATPTPAPAAKELGFSAKQGANWSEYLDFRPLYPQSFFDRIFAYHGEKLNSAWSVAHDIGAGCGIVSSSLARQFHTVAVSDPNDGYVNIARKLLVEQSHLPASKFLFLQEGAEKSTVSSGSVDVATVCECIHWTDTAQTLREVRRELKVGGTAVVSHYTVPRIVGNTAAQKVWKLIWDEYSKVATGPLLDHAFPIINTGFESLEFPAGEWEAVKRVYINAQGDLGVFRMNDRVGQSRVQDGEQRVWLEGDDDWADSQDIAWFKGYLATWVPVIPEADIQGLWDELEAALGGKKVRIETPIAVVMATKRG